MQTKVDHHAQPPGVSAVGARGGSAATRATWCRSKSLSAAAVNHVGCRGSQTTSPPAFDADYGTLLRFVQAALDRPSSRTRVFLDSVRLELTVAGTRVAVVELFAKPGDHMADKLNHLG